MVAITAFHTSHITPTLGGMGSVDSQAGLTAFDASNQPAASETWPQTVIHLSTGPIVVSTSSDGSVMVNGKLVEAIKK